MPTPFDKVLTNAGAVGPNGKVSSAERDKFVNKVGDLLKNGSSISGLEFPPDPNAEETIKRLKESKSWNKTYVDGLLQPTIEMMDTPGNLPLFPVHDPSSTFGFDVSLQELKDPSIFTPNVILSRSGGNFSLQEIPTKLADIQTSIPAIPPVPQLPPIPGPDSVLDGFDIKRSDLALSAEGVNMDLAGKKVQEITTTPIEMFSALLKAPLDVFKNLLGNIGDTFLSITDGTLPQKILKLITDLIKDILEAIGVIVSTAIALVSTLLAWAYKIVSAIAASIVSAIIGSGSISTAVYNA